jgi:hypothetical protein
MTSLFHQYFLLLQTKLSRPCGRCPGWQVNLLLTGPFPRKLFPGDEMVVAKLGNY